MGGVQRISKFAKYLPEYNFEPLILTSAITDYYAKDENLYEEIVEKNIKVFRTSGKDKVISKGSSVSAGRSEKFRKFLSKASQVFLSPDTKILWKKTAIAKAEEIIVSEKPDIIFATAPPYTDFLIGNYLSLKYSIPLVIDYRDAWVDCPYNFYPTPLHRIYNEKLERKILINSSAVVTINEEIKGIILKRYKEIPSEKIRIISQGYDEEDFEKSGIKEKTDGKFRITYSGSFFNFMTPEFFLKGLRKAIDKRPEIESGTEALFVGIFPPEYNDLIKKLNLENIVTLKGYVNHKECIEFIKSSDALWFMIGESKWSYMISTGKLYEYIGSGKPILACIPEGTAKNLLKQYGNSLICSPQDVEAISDNIIKLFEQYQTGAITEGNRDFRKKFSRKKLTSELAELLNEILLLPG